MAVADRPARIPSGTAMTVAIRKPKNTVWIDADLFEEELRIAVGDDGPGFSPDILPKLGEPYVSTRARGSRKKTDAGYEGMGLGLFIARTLMERTGASVSFANGTDLRRGAGGSADQDAEDLHPPGAIIEFLWPEEMLIASKVETRGPLGPNLRFEGN